METSQTHFRSISLPARLHATAQQKTKLQNMNSYNIPTSVAIKADLLKLSELCTSLHEMKAQFQVFDKDTMKSMEELLADSVDLIDTCSTIREVFQIFRETVQTLQSAIRRKGLVSSIQIEIAGYVSCRKKMNKSAANTLKLLKNLEHSYSNRGDLIKEATMRVFRNILGLLNLSAVQNNFLGGWSLASKLMITRPTEVVNEIGDVDLEVKWLQRMMRKNTGNGDGIRVNMDDQVRRIQVSLQEVDRVVGGFDGGLEDVMRHLVQTRVSLLNLITDHYL